MCPRKLQQHLWLTLALGGFSMITHAAGFQLLEQNASGLGNAYAGSGVNAENASVLYFNPAAMTYLPGSNVSGSVTAIRPSFKFRNDGRSTTPLATRGSNGGDAGGWGGPIFTRHGNSITTGM